MELAFGVHGPGKVHVILLKIRKKNKNARGVGILMKNKFRYYVFTMLTFITMVNYIDRGAIAYAQSFIIKEYGFDPKEWGAILGYFGYGYMIGSLLGGIFQIKGPKFVWIVAATAWSIFEIATAFAGEIGIAVLEGLL